MNGDHLVRRSRLAIGTGRHAPLRAEEHASASDDVYQDEIAQILHDLKNPLASIALDVELMGDRPENRQVTPSLDRIRRNVWYLDRLIYDLVDLCTLATGRLALRRARCDLAELLAAVIERVVPVTERHRVFLDAADPIIAMVDELRIERVVANLIDNALKYAASSAGIIVRLARDEGCARVSICDGGPGIAPAEIATVFQPYCRGSTSVGRPGSGLGLYISKAIVEAHRGKIGVDSERGVGARFYFAVPLGH